MNPDTHLRNVIWYTYVGYGFGVIALVGYIFTRQPWMLIAGLSINLVTNLWFRRIRQTREADQQH